MKILLQACFEFIFQNFAFFFQSQPPSLGPSLSEEAVGFYQKVAFSGTEAPQGERRQILIAGSCVAGKGLFD